MQFAQLDRHVLGQLKNILAMEANMLPSDAVSLSVTEDPVRMVFTCVITFVNGSTHKRVFTKEFVTNIMASAPSDPLSAKLVALQQLLDQQMLRAYGAAGAGWVARAE
jgi:hypothetical protein